MQKTLFMIHPHGFCPGVRNALNIVNQALQDYSQQTIYVFNEIVHNKTIVTNLKNKGVIFTQNCVDIVAKSVVILSAHGVSPDVKKTLLSKNCILIDATCHFVNKVHQEVIDYSKKGYHIIYIGTKNHEETLGVVGENPSNITIIETDADFANIKVDADKYVVLNQTTLNLDDIENLFKKIKIKFTNVVFPSTADLCLATKSRQSGLKKVLNQCDLVIIIGSQNSSNSRKLRDIALKNGKTTYLIDNYQEIKNEWLKNHYNIALTAGASAPEFLVTETIKFLTHKGYRLIK